ncbi:MAG: hypothetical protein PSN37_02280 [Alphaproteobacteria bacterium]|nr:hypothetical protein [Alphaproteobacteria bacterium]
MGLKEFEEIYLSQFILVKPEYPATEISHLLMSNPRKVHQKFVNGFREP